MIDVAGNSIPLVRGGNRTGTPPAIVTGFHAEFVRTLRAPQGGSALRGLGSLPSPMQVAQFTEFVGAKTRRWDAVIKRAGVTVD